MIRIDKNTKKIVISNDCQFTEPVIKIEIQSAMKLDSIHIQEKIEINERFYAFEWRRTLEKGQHEFILTQEKSKLVQRVLVFVEFDELDDKTYTPKEKKTRIYKRK